MLADWRQTPRFALRVPLWIRSMEASQMPSQKAETSNISASGAYILTDLPCHPGTIVEMFLKMPAQVSGSVDSEWCCKGRVLRAEDGDAVEHAERYVAVEFQYYEVLGRELSDGAANRSMALAQERTR